MTSSAASALRRQRLDLAATAPARVRFPGQMSTTEPVRARRTAPTVWRRAGSGKDRCRFAQECPMYLARFSYDVLPANRQRAIDLIRREVETARRDGRNARLLVPLTRGQGGAALQFEVELDSLDQLERVRHSGDPGEDVASLMQDFSEFLLAPPGVEILRVAEGG